MASLQNNLIMHSAAAVLAIAAIIIYMNETHSKNATPPLGPVITAGLADKFCGINDVQVSRLPLNKQGTSSWSTILSIIHSSPPLKGSSKTQPSSLEPLILHEGKLCIKISRATLMTLFAITNARPIYIYPSAAAYRSAFPSYSGQWAIWWRIGKPCIISLSPHDSHKIENDVYPASFPVRVDKCIEMLCGIISDQKSWKLAFPGRPKGKGPYVLIELKKGFPSAHGARDLYNMMGGHDFEVDQLVLSPGGLQNSRKIEVPCVDSDSDFATVFLPQNVEKLLARALDCLPWSQLSWSMHRGLRDILLAYGTPVMDRYRAKFGKMVKDLSKLESFLVTMGWNANFVHEAMGEMAHSAITSGNDNSGDLVRVVVAIVEAWLQKSEGGFIVDKDNTDFWRRQSSTSRTETELSPILVVALMKFVVLKWSQELDYQLYHQLPTELFVQ